MKDQRRYLKVKIKSLMAEARIIRNEQARTKDPELKQGLAAHRTGVVRNEARHTHLAIAFLRNRDYKQIEAKCTIKPDWAKVKKMVDRYGVCWDRINNEKWSQYLDRKKEESERFEAWKNKAL